MNYPIPFLYSLTDLDGVAESYPETAIVRVEAHTTIPVQRLLRRKFSLWIDPGIDGIVQHDKSSFEEKLEDGKNPWFEHIASIPNYGLLLHPERIKVMHRASVCELACVLLDKCKALKPRWITVPQLPCGQGASNNKINQYLAEGTAKWKNQTGFSGELVVPFITTKKEHLIGLPEQRRRVSQVFKISDLLKSRIVWFADTSIKDYEASGTLGAKRIPLILQTVKLLGDRPEGAPIIVAGPFWGVNLLLWARGEIGYPAIHLGSRFNYNLPGGVVHKALHRIMIGELFRLTVVDQDLRGWLERLGSLDAPRAQVDVSGLSPLSEAKTRYTQFYSDSHACKQQIRRQYSSWVSRLLHTPPEGRRITLYQLLSQSYVYGSQLPHMDSDKPSINPGDLAKAFMDNCLTQIY